MALKYKAPEPEVSDGGTLLRPAEPAQVMNPPEAAQPAGTHNPNVGPDGIDLSDIPTHQDGRPLNMRARLELYHTQQVKKRMAEIEARRNKPVEPPKPHVTQPVAPAIRAQTESELAAGRAISARHAEQQAARTYPAKKEPWEGTNTPVYKSGEFTEEKAPAKSRVASQAV